MSWALLRLSLLIFYTWIIVNCVRNICGSQYLMLINCYALYLGHISPKLCGDQRSISQKSWVKSCFWIVLLSDFIEIESDTVSLQANEFNFCKYFEVNWKRSKFSAPSTGYCKTVLFFMQGKRKHNASKRSNCWWGDWCSQRMGEHTEGTISGKSDYF